MKVDGEENVLLVDVGGGIGRDISEFKSKFPDVKGRLILQEKHGLIKTIRGKLAGIEPMGRGYSKILINENVIPDFGASWKATSLDMYMMSLAASAERTEKQWRELLASVGLRVAGIWNDDPGTESLIEAVLEREEKL